LETLVFFSLNLTNFAQKNIGNFSQLCWYYKIEKKKKKTKKRKGKENKKKKKKKTLINVKGMETINK